MPKPVSVEIGPEPSKGQGRVRRHWKYIDKLLESPEEGIDTLYDIAERSSRLFGNRDALGWRETVKVHDVEKEITKVIKGKEIKEKKTWQYFELGPYKYHTYKQFYDLVCQAGSGLAELGLNKETIFNVYSSTKPNWQIVANACASQSITFATAYDSLGEEGLTHSIDEPGVVGLFTNANLLSTLAKVIKDTPTLKFVIYDEKAEDEKTQKALKTISEHARVLTLDELFALGKEHPHEVVKPGAMDTACIMYTSGSTGAPKGVVISHRNLTSGVAAIMAHLGDKLVPGETFIAYLPLAHILELIVETCCLYIGITMGYGTVKTLTDNSVKNCVGDIKEFRPTVMVGVPAVWELIRKGIMTKVKAGGSVKEKLFNGAVAAKRYSSRILGPVADAVVFKQVKQATGGRLKYALSGGAALSRTTQEFLSIALVEMMQGYGLTESCGMCAIVHPDLGGFGHVGAPVPSIEVKLVDVEEANYFTSNKPSQGEVWIRGHSVTKGYYKRDDITKESFSEDGWFMTGDIGQWNDDGSLSLIDRKKNLIKLSGGEYIALERLESVYKSCNLVSNICVHADPSANRPMAIIFPHEVNLKSFASSKGLCHQDEDFESLCKEDKVKEAFLRELNDVGKKAGFKPLEQLQCIVLTSKEWTPHNGLLTAAQKLQRKSILKEYESDVKQVYP